MPFNPPKQIAKGFGTPSWTLPFSSNVTSGNIIIVFGTLTGAGAGSANPTDNLGNTYIRAVAQTDVAGAGLNVWYCFSIAGGACTLTFPSNSASVVIMAEYNMTSGSLDVANSSTNATIPFSITTTHATELLVAVCINGLQPTTWGVSGSFVIETQEDASNPQPVSLVLCDQTVNSTGTYSVSFTEAPSFSADGAILGFFGTAMTVNCNNPPVGTVGVPYTTTFTASGGTAPYTFTISAGSLPPGITLASNGVASGVPTASGLYSFTVQATDATSATGTAVCTINILAPTTLRFEIPKKRWFPHAYADTIVTHYLDETFLGNVNKEQLLLLSAAKGFIYTSGGDTDNGSVIPSTVITPSMDGGDPRIQKLYVDIMTDLDGTGTVKATAQFNNQTTTGATVSYTPIGTRIQQLQNISSLSSLNLYRNLSVAYTWTGGPDGPRLYICEPAGYAQPYISTFIVTQFINLAFPGWKHHRQLYAGYISNSNVLFTIKTQDGRTYGPYTLPSTGGQFQIITAKLDQNIKDLAFAYQLDGQGQNFVLFPEAFTIETKEWTEPSYIPLAIFKT